MGAGHSVQNSAGSTCILHSAVVGKYPKCFPLQLDLIVEVDEGNEVEQLPSEDP